MSEYTGFDIKQLWQMVDAARQGLEPSHDQALALDKAQQMLSGHAQALETARDQLTAKWPPETNAASAAYIAELDRLITAVRDTSLSCAINVFHLTLVSDAIVQTHESLSPLHDEYVANENALERYNAEIDAFSTGAASIPGGRTIARLFTSPPVKDGRQTELTQKAQQAMVTLSQAAEDGATHIKPPTPYTPPTVTTGIEDHAQEIGGVSHEGAIAPPAIDPPAHSRNETADPPSISSTGEGLAQSSAVAGPILSDFTPGPTAPTGGATFQSGSPAGPGGLAGVVGPVFTTELRRPPSAIGAPAGGLGTRPRAGSAAEEVPAERGALRGGVIGSVPGAMRQTGVSTSRVNPPGGVIGQQHTGPVGRGTGRSIGRASRAATLGPQAGRRGSRVSGADGGRWDPENPWEIDEGVNPVILPEPPPGPVDPGPGIIGIDR